MMRKARRRVTLIEINSDGGETMLSSVRTAVVVLSTVSAFALGATGASSPAIAQEDWVAVAADGKGYWGYAFGEATEEQARATALQGCGRSGCNIEGAARARCFAYVESREGAGYWYGVGIGPTEDGVLATAQRGCGLGAPQGTCRVVKASCH